MDLTPIVPGEPIVLAHEKPFRIGEAEIRPATREVVRDGAARILEPRVMQLLVVLHRADGGVVSKDDLIQLCWEGRVVGEDAINRVVSRLRHDAVEKAGGAFRIETITKVGYRLVGESGDRPGGFQGLAVNRRRAIAAGLSVAAAAGGSAVAWRMFGKPEWPAEARSLHEQGWAAFRDGTVDQVASAAAKFRREADLAPERAEPWGSLALAYQKQAGMAPLVQRPSLKSRSRDAARRALAIDPGNGDAIAANAMEVPLFGNWMTYERTWRRAAIRAPRHPVVNVAIASLHSAVGRFRAALGYVERALEAEPTAMRLRQFRATLLWDTGRIEEAETAFEEAFRLWPRNYAIWFSRYYFLAYNGRAQEALAMIHDSATRPIGIPDWNFEATELQGKALANPTRAAVDAAITATLSLAKRGVGFAEGGIAFAGALGRTDTAFTIMDAYYFDRGFTLGEQRYSKEQGMYAAPRERHTYFLFAPRTAPLRRDRRFAPLIETLGLNAYWRGSGTLPDYRA
jgi:DNA-binding winged helix-turn-helix (wHTH) protein/tetratricopeptide (TPR) repeat protein